MFKKAVSILTLLITSAPVFAEEYSLTVEDKAAPAEVSSDISEQLVAKAHQISDSEGVFFEFWFAKNIEVSAIADTAKKTLDNLEEIALIGVAVVHENEEEYVDFREDPIDPGTYIMRLSLQPQDGNHMGTSPFDTFAILIPHEKDEMVLEFMDPEEMVDIASEDTPAEHPPILSLQPTDDAEGEFPHMEVEEEEEWHFLCIKMPAKAGDATAELALKLVVVGIGEL